jgi:nucleoside-diphosphate-sugar epimerase
VAEILMDFQERCLATDRDDMFRAEDREFLEAVAQDRAVVCTIAEARRSLEWCWQLREASSGGNSKGRNVMKVLVTGGSSRVGAYVLRDLVAHGHAVSNFGRTPPLVAGVPHLPGVIEDLATLRQAVQGHEAVIHLAGIARPRRATPEDLMRINVIGTFNVLEAAIRAGAGKVVFASTDATLGFAFPTQPKTPLYLPVDEEHPCTPEDEYGLSKLMGEMMCRRYTDAYGLATPCVRINSAWALDGAGAEGYAQSGPMRASPGTAEDIWAAYTRQLDLPEGPMPVPGAPAPRVRLWGYTDARDTAQAIRLALENQRVTHDIFLTSADDSCSLLETEALIHHYWPGMAMRAPLPGFASLFSHERATQVLGYQPQYTWRNSDFSAWRLSQGATQ